jgi:hypothetical protein
MAYVKKKQALATAAALCERVHAKTTIDEIYEPYEEPCVVVNVYKGKRVVEIARYIYEPEQPWLKEGTLCFVWNNDTRPNTPPARYTTTTRGYFMSSDYNPECISWQHWEPVLKEDKGRVLVGETLKVLRKLNTMSGLRDINNLGRLLDGLAEQMTALLEKDK